ncbi:MAG: 4'-phosphopantetheinyl transferase superfamily protein [Rhizobiaceae bacterium]|nr:4'-phosphopantetheinyl transferase superfamily protein [Rhizobiaceae bacterium]
MFAAEARDWTPASSQAEVCVLYVPVSQASQTTKLCAAVLSASELERTDRFVSEDDKTLFLQRRAFRRYCGALALGQDRPLSQIEFMETKNGGPYLSELPNVWFSFSSCTSGMIAAWSSTHAIGVDLEVTTQFVEANDLAQEHFSVTEAKIVAELDGAKKLRTLYQFWGLKEAALKSIGEGLPFGLDKFEFQLGSNPSVIRVPQEYGGSVQFEAHLIEEHDLSAALIIRRNGDDGDGGV